MGQVSNPDTCLIFMPLLVSEMDMQWFGAICRTVGKSAEPWITNDAMHQLQRTM